MKKKNNIKNRCIGMALVLTFIVTGLSSCKNEESSQITPEGALVTVNLIAAESESAPDVIVGDNAAATVVRTGSTTQTTTQALGESNTLVVSLTSNTATASQNASTNTGAVNANKAAVIQQPLAAGTKYELLVYNNVGNFVTRQTYTYGQEATAAVMKLNAGQSYTFIVVSTNSTSTTPTVTNPNQLSTATVSNINTALLYFKSTVTLNEGNNNLNVILKHQFSEITTTLRMEANTTGNITAIANPVFKTVQNSGNLKLSDGVLTYNGINTNGQPLSFSGLGTRLLTSPAILIINPATSTAVLNLGNITIDGETKPIVVNNLKITPGHRYSLDLTLKTCTQNVSGANGLDWDYPEIFSGGRSGVSVNGTFVPRGGEISKTFTAPSADYGFVLDITKLDNSFNMKVNSVMLASKEIQFENSTNPVQVQNIQFADGSKYGGVNTEGGTVPQIYNMTGTAANPLIKIVISRFNKVTMFGSKKSGGPLYPLVLLSGTSFNNFSWAGAGTNTVEVTQIVAGKTTMQGTGAGKKKVSCNLTN
jgi:hypothetical protein